MIKRSLMALVLLAASASPAMAKDNEESEKPDSERVVCKTQRVTGSRLPGERICKPKGEWERDKKEAKRRMDELIEDRSSTVNTGG
jgi:hypothetical protein